MHRNRTSIALLACLAATCATPAAAVPIPWKNCGQAGNTISIQKADASVWPPQVPAPAEATATFDGDGKLVNLRIFLVHGIAWTFDSGPLPSSTSGGFVTIPASFPVTVSSPPLPITAGPGNTTMTFGEGGPTPVTVVGQSTIGHDIVAPVTTTVGFSTNGSPGFPLSPAPNSAYALHVDMIEPSGARAFCMDITIPIEGAAPLVSIERKVSVPASSPSGLLILGIMLLATPLIAHRRRR